MTLADPDKMHHSTFPIVTTILFEVGIGLWFMIVAERDARPFAYKMGWNGFFFGMVMFAFAGGLGWATRYGSSPTAWQFIGAAAVAKSILFLVVVSTILAADDAECYKIGPGDLWQEVDPEDARGCRNGFGIMLPIVLGIEGWVAYLCWMSAKNDGRYYFDPDAPSRDGWWGPTRYPAASYGAASSAAPSYGSAGGIYHLEEQSRPVPQQLPMYQEPIQQPAAQWAQPRQQPPAQWEPFTTAAEPQQNTRDPFDNYG